ncbi:MAG TPA: hypothetical protein VHU87_08590 [Rhizomicrobium sp.]|jgi:hypothetical protein|nr:hypothetical protein [Rhizomicrobium sp.]
MSKAFTVAPGSASGSASVALIPFAELESPVLQNVFAAWQEWRGSGAMPPREKLSLRRLGNALKYISLARVLDDGVDYEFRTIGDAHVQAYGTSYQHRRVSDVITASPKFGRRLKGSYDLVRKSGCAYAFRSEIGWDAPDKRFVLFETCYLPLGAGRVDHILNAAVYAPQDRH